jgi:hypothetical protein
MLTTNRGSNSGRGKRFFSSPKQPDCSLGPPSLVFKGYRGLFPQDLSGQGVKLITYFLSVLRLRISGGVSPFFHMPSWNAQDQSHLADYNVCCTTLQAGQVTFRLHKATTNVNSMCFATPMSA